VHREGERKREKGEGGRGVREEGIGFENG